MNKLITRTTGWYWILLDGDDAPEIAHYEAETEEVRFVGVRGSHPAHLVVSWGSRVAPDSFTLKQFEECVNSGWQRK